MAESIIDDLGREVTAILGPVTLCIAITVVLVRVLNPAGSTNPTAVGLATAFYSESVADSPWEKFAGGLANALVFVVAIGLMTFVLVYAFKKGYASWIVAYMGFAAFGLFFLLDGFIALGLLQRAGVAWDWPSLLAIAFNSAAVGALTLFAFPAPLLVKQGYLVALAVGTAFVFTFVPEWTTWLLLIAMALYDLVAVLAPWGPLKMLVELAEERDEPIPALVYSARPVGGAGTGAQAWSSAPIGPGGEAGGAARALATRALLPPNGDAEEGRGLAASEQGGRSGIGADDGAAVRHSPTAAQPAEPEDEAAALLPPEGAAADRPSSSAPPASDAEFELPDAIRLGLGDFIFYSVMIGRASMHSALAAAACYVAVAAGLVCTLAWLAVSQHALPALPISIALGVLVFAGNQLALEPMALPWALRGLVF